MENGQSELQHQSNTEVQRLGIKDYVTYLLAMVVNGLLIFIPAGRIGWLEGWIWIGLLSFYIGITTLYGAHKDPELVLERSLSGKRKGVLWDRIIVNVHNVLFLGIYVVAGLDAGRFGWSQVSWTVKGFAIFVLLIGIGINIWAMLTNPFLSAVVRIQNDRGHYVVTSGPYQYVRHPMYVGVLLIQISAPLILGSLWALIPAGLDALLFIIRTSLEDSTLQAELQGYQAYTQQVRYRLFPGIW
jgi:protein-S-isoprenylcysteine O-methyltransferase Ste14